eukprot:12758598-Alexandrium_andersonii.AAC.1
MKYDLPETLAAQLGQLHYPARSIVPARSGAHSTSLAGRRAWPATENSSGIWRRTMGRRQLIGNGRP